MKIEVGKFYRTRSGSQVKVIAIDIPGQRKVVTHDKYGNLVTLYSNGKLFPDGDCYADLVDYWDPIEQEKARVHIPWDKLFSKEIKWFAVDKDGAQYGYSMRPQYNHKDGLWMSNGMFVRVTEHSRVNIGPIPPHEALFERPE